MSDSAPQFELIRTLAGHSNAVNVLAFSPDQTFLLSGGDDGLLVVWSLNDGKKHQVLQFFFHGPVTSAVWTCGVDSASPNGLLVGCANGTLHFYQRIHSTSQFVFVTTEWTSPARGPVEEIAYDPLHSRVAAAASPASVTLWNLTKEGTLMELHSATREELTVSSISFIEKGNQLVVSYLESHEVLAIQIDTWTTLWHHTLPKRIGSAIVVPPNGFVTTNLMTGIDVFNFPPTKLLQTYPHNITHNIRLQLASLWSGQLVVMGSDDGQPRAIDRANSPRTRPEYYTLPHGGDWVQTIAASDAPSGSLIATAASKTDSHSVIKVWRCAESSGDTQSDAEKGRSPHTSLSVRQLALIVLLCCLMQTLTSQLPLGGAFSAIVSVPSPLRPEVRVSSSTVRPDPSQVEQGREADAEVYPKSNTISTRDLDLWKGGFCE